MSRPSRPTVSVTLIGGVTHGQRKGGRTLRDCPEAGGEGNNSLLFQTVVSRFGLAGKAAVSGLVKRMDLGSIPLRLSFLFKKVAV